MKFPKTLAVAASALGLAMACSSTWAAGLQVSPTMVTFQGNDTSEVLHLFNRSDSSSTMQIRVFKWTQDKGEDLLDTTDDILASPPVQQVDAGGEQVVRIVRQGAPAGNDEQCYRVLVDELPQAAAIKGAGVNMLLRFSVPLFIPPTGGGKPVIKVRWGVGADGKHQIQMENTGNVHAQIVAPRLVENGHETPLNAGLYGYVLPHQTRGWALAPATGKAADSAGDALYNHTGVSLKLQLNGTEVTVPVNAS